MHYMLALGAGLLTVALTDFRSARLATLLGRLSLGAIAAIFLIQGVAQTTNSARLSQIAFQTLGQRLEGWLVAGFLFWCVALLIADSRGKTRLLGLGAVALTVAVRAYDIVLAQQGASMDEATPGLKLIYLSPFVWLLFESRKSR
jgi:hypothetical protein